MTVSSQAVRLLEVRSQMLLLSRLQVSFNIYTFSTLISLHLPVAFDPTDHSLFLKICGFYDSTYGFPPNSLVTLSHSLLLIPHLLSNLLMLKGHQPSFLFCLYSLP